MARPLRIEFPGAYYYIVQQANGFEKIFKSKEDSEIFFDYLQKAIIRYDLRLHSFLILPSSFHILLETIDANLSRAMHFLNTGFTMRYNALHKRHGHLFRGRYKAFLIQPGEFLCYMSRRCHLEPVNRKLAVLPEDYLLSSYRFMIDPDIRFQGLTTDAVLGYFDQDKTAASSIYKRFVESAIGKKDVTYEKNLHGGFILGSTDFVEWMKKSFMDGKDASEIPVIKKFQPAGPDPVRIKEIIDREFKEVRLKRKLSIYLIRKHTQHKLKNIAKLFLKNL